MLRCVRLAESGSGNQRSRNGTDSDHGIRMSPIPKLSYTAPRSNVAVPRHMLRHENGHRLGGTGVVVWIIGYADHS